MNWYYVEQGRQAGPLSDEQFNALIQNGTITADTLVWREGMAEWLPCGQVHASGATGATGTETAPQVVCAECGRIFPVDDTIRYGDVRVCANCKPVFLQKLQEGAAVPTGALNYAAFWPRCVAYFLDYIILVVFNWTVQFVVGFFGALLMGTSHGTKPAAAMGLVFVSMGVLLGFNICYEGILVGKYGATLGKMAMKMKVVTADGGRVSYARAFGRYFAKILSGLTCLIGFIIAGFDNPQRRALQDYICNTRVVYK